MKCLPVLVCAALVGWCGCAGHKAPNDGTGFDSVPGTASTSTNKPATVSSTPLIVTPETGLTGKVVAFNNAGRFVVLNFPIGRMPALEQRLFLYRQGLKIGEVKITGPQRDDNIIADVTQGEAQAGDEVRAH